jgi:hypothetical protein
LLDYIKIILLFTTCLIILLTLIKPKWKSLPKDESGFLLSSLYLTLFLAIIIEIKPHHFFRITFSISNLMTYLFYFVLVGFYFIKNIKTIFQNKFPLIIITFTLFGLANTLDLLSDGKLITYMSSEIAEDILHNLGIVLWMLFFADYSKRIRIKYL